MKDPTEVVALGLLGLAIIIAAPMGLIWCLNTLFQSGIEHTGWNWLAAAGLMVFLRGASGK